MNQGSTIRRLGGCGLAVLLALLLLSVGAVANERVTKSLDALHAGSALERAEAAQSLAYERDARIGPALIESLRDTDRFVRWRAAESLAVQEYPLAVPELERLVANDPDATVRSKAEAAVMRLKATAAYAVHALRASPDEQERQRAAAKLAYGLDTPELVPALMAALDDKSAGVRAAACESLAVRKPPAAVPALIRALDVNAKNDPRVASAAADALGAIGDPRALDGLVAALRAQSPVVESALKALTLLKDSRAVPGIVELQARGNLYSYPVAQALKAIGQHGLDALVATLEERPPRPAEQRYAIAIAIRYAADARLEEGVLRVLADADPAVRSELATALGRMKSRRAVPVLTRLIDDPDRLVPPSAVGALGEIGDRSATATLVRLLADPARKDLHDNAVGALGMLADPAAAGALAARLHSTRNQTTDYDHLRAAQALCAIGGARAKTALLDALRSGDAVAARGAHRCLIGYGEPGTDSLIATALAAESARYDDTFAQACFLSGNAALRAAAEAWAQKHGKKLSDWTSQPLRWGQGAK